MADPANQQPSQEALAPAEGDEDGFGAEFDAEVARRQAEASGTRQDGDEPSPKEPAPAGSDLAPAPAAVEEATGGNQAQALDPWAGMTPEQRKHWEGVQQAERSHYGRATALDRKLRNLATVTPAPTAAPKRPAQEEQPPGGDDEGQSVAESLEDRLNKAVEEYGDVNGPLVEALREIRAEVASMKQAATSLAEVDADAEQLADARKALGEAHPDWQTIVADPSFTAWATDQTDKVRDLLNSFDPRETSLGLALYKAERSASLAPQASENGAEGTQAGTATDRRARQIEGSVQVPNRAASTAAAVPDDFDSAWDAAAKKKAAQRAAEAHT